MELGTHLTVGSLITARKMLISCSKGAELQIFLEKSLMTSVFSKRMRRSSKLLGSLKEVANQIFRGKDQDSK